MQEKIEYLLEKECRTIHIVLKNGNIMNIITPNQNDNTVTIEDGYIKWVKNEIDGCIYEAFVPIDEISYIEGSYGCPQ